MATGSMLIHQSNEAVVKDLRRWQRHASMFVDFAKKTITSSRENQRQLKLRAEAAYTGMIEFVEELHQQLLTCVNKFTTDLKSFMDCQLKEIDSRNELLAVQIMQAETNIKDIDALMKSEQRLPIDGPFVAKRCEEFFSVCYEGNGGGDSDFNYVEFMPIGRLIVRPDHLGYIRLCDAWPNEVDVVLIDPQSMCGCECRVLVHTNRRHCTDALPYLNVGVTDPSGGSFAAVLKNNNDGSYFAVFTPTSPGTHSLSVQLFGIEVKDSPVSVSVIQAPEQPIDSIASSFNRGLNLSDSSMYAGGDCNQNIVKPISKKRSGATAHGHGTQLVRKSPGDLYAGIEKIEAGAAASQCPEPVLESFVDPVLKLLGASSAEACETSPMGRSVHNHSKHSHSAKVLQSAKPDPEYQDVTLNGKCQLSVHSASSAALKTPGQIKGDVSLHGHSHVETSGSSMNHRNDASPGSMADQFVYREHDNCSVMGSKNEQRSPSVEPSHSTSQFGSAVCFDDEDSVSGDGCLTVQGESKNHAVPVLSSTTLYPFGFNNVDDYRQQTVKQEPASPPSRISTSFWAKTISASEKFSSCDENIVHSKHDGAGEVESYLAMSNYGPPAPPERCSILLEYISRGVQKVKTEFVGKIGQPGDRDECLFLPVGVTVSQSSDVVVCDMRHNSVKIFTMNGQLIRVIKGQANRKLQRPSAAVVNQENLIFIKDDNCIHVYDSEGIFIRLIGSEELARPYGLAMNDDHNLMTVNVPRNGIPTVCVYTQDGELISQQVLKPMLDPMLASGSKCRFVECLGDEFFVVDLGKSVIFKTDFSGNLRSIFGRYGRALGEFNEPSGITRAGNNVLLIADSRNNRIQVFTPDGQVHGYIDLAESIIRPSDIHLTDDGYLFVSNYLKHCIKVFRILPP